MVDEVMKFITEADPEVGEAIEAEAARQRRNLELIASENIVSEPVMMAMGPKSPSNERLSRSPRKALLPAGADRAPTSRTRRGFPARCFFKARTTVPRAFRMSTAGKR